MKSVVELLMMVFPLRGLQNIFTNILHNRKRFLRHITNELNENEWILKNKNFHVTIQENKGNIIFLQKIGFWREEHSFGIVAKLAGMPSKVVNRASEIWKTLEDFSFQQWFYRKNKTCNQNTSAVFLPTRWSCFGKTSEKNSRKIDITTFNADWSLNEVGMRLKRWLG